MMERNSGLFSSRKHSWISAVLFCISLLALFLAYLPSLKAHVDYSREHFNDDECQHISAFLRDLQKDDPRDYIESYCLALLPTGYKGLYSAVSKAVDPRAVSRFLPYGLLAVFLLGAGLSAGRIGGYGAALAAVAFGLSSDIFLSRMTGGLPRSFAFPLSALCAYAVISARYRLLAALVLFGAAFYPSVSVSAGLALAVSLFLVPKGDRGAAFSWSLRKRVILIAAAAALALAVVLPQALSLRPYGPSISAGQRQDFKEIGPGGRFNPGDRPDFDLSLWKAAYPFWEVSFLNKGAAWAPFKERLFLDGDKRDKILFSLFLFSVLLMLFSAWKRPDVRRLFALTLSVFAAFEAAKIFSPYLFLPQRQIAYMVPVLSLLWLAAGASCAGSLLSGVLRLREKNQRAAAAALSLSLWSILFLCFGGKIQPSSGLTANRSSDDLLNDFLSALPAGSFIAGWPNVMDPVPYLAKKPVLVSYSTHLPFHVGYSVEMRKRMRMLVDAYFAAAPKPLVDLKKDMGVTHLVIDKRHLTGRPHRYFRPFDEWVDEAAKKTAEESCWIMKEDSGGIVFSQDPYFVVDLEKVGEIDAKKSAKQEN